jgi:hypothetical protein
LENQGQEVENGYWEVLLVNKTIKNWNQLPAIALGTFPCKPKIFRKSVRKAIISRMKQKKHKCGENRLKVQ